MKKLLSIFFVVTLFVNIALAQDVWRVDFSKSSNPKWNFAKNSSIENVGSEKVFSAKLPDASKRDSTLSVLNFDIEKYRGKSIFISADIKTSGISNPNHFYDGGRVQLFFESNGKPNWRDIKIPNDTKGIWKTLSTNTIIPSDAKNAKLSIGLTECGGFIEIKNLRVETETPFIPNLPKDFKAKYSQSIKNYPRMRGMNLVSIFKYTQNDIDDLASWNANLIRWQISRNYKKPYKNRDIAEYDKWIDSEIVKIKEIAAYAQKHNIQIIIEMHTTVGGVDEKMDMLMFYEDVYAKHFIKVWQKLALELKDVPNIWGYDLINEPIQTRPTANDYLKLQFEAAKAIRKINKEIPIIIASKNWNNPDSFAKLYPLDLNNIVYSVHMYRPHDYTHQGLSAQAMKAFKAGKVVTYPSKNYDKKYLINELKPVIDFQKKYGVRIFVGEYGLVRWAPNSGQYLKDCIEIFEEQGWDWANHAYRESYDGFSAEHSDDINVKEKDINSSRLKALKEGFKLNK